MTILYPLQFISALVLSVFLSFSQPSLGATYSESGTNHSPYDDLFRQYGEQYLPELDWLWFAAQAKQESLFDPRAVSSAGARGVMQLMPKTFAEQSQRLRENCSPWSPRCSIKLGIHYNKRMFDQFKRPFAEQRIPWMLASYNAGLGTVLRHQAACGGSRAFVDVMPCLYDETRDYVERIHDYYYNWRNGSH